MFELDERLKKDSVKVGEFPLCELRLINDANYTWFVLVPKRVAITEIYQLEEPDRHMLMNESCLLAETLHDAFSPDKLNVAAIGNKVHQLHLHHVVRFTSDKAWPEPVWGKFPALAYKKAELASILQKIRVLLADDLIVTEDTDGQLYF
ncbi:HIT domain-containing protein [Marinomonas sp. PE14-40]|uniref:HIT domain-containing protein n=1 Tax=Marinomonas sp. PE14-40 TaxID=3060621 RepID=UPI003F675896